MITVPPGFGDALGDGAPAWVATLPALAEEVCARWDLVPDGEVLHGFVAVVLPVRRADGTPAVLKLTWRDEETEHEGLALRLWDGRGVVRLLDHDGERGALLLERLDPARTLEHAPIGVALDVIGGLLRDLRVPAPPEVRRAGVDDLAASAMASTVSKPLLDAAVAMARDLAADIGDTLVNGDLHYGNVLAGEREPWLMIDPKPRAGDPEFCLIPLLWNRFGELGGPAAMWRRFDALVDVAGLDAEKAHGWALARAVSAAFWALEAGLPDFGAMSGAVAGWLFAGRGRARGGAAPPTAD
ncbi:aminoglycoside phosphotransferase family protein [Umezawaea sp. Da 62-37]|uniref:aminoglycoside phosphotransferase family protein n=1 Tax=Umezawaea sp. Da 62-37 TaxID=3075927 RepID=UPI0028F6CA0B|nr:aminoglycoside phosphotransferase family protein [Umezawaea sp. Da 62-37]WNV82439.1 aminoglycoside phosphotransferase family protein [Umezawaea sp. Da 62-37]